MNKPIQLAKKTLIFYLIIGVPIIVGSFYNVVYGLLLGQTSIVRIGAFSLFGFVLVPLLLISTYKKNKCIILNDKVIIGKTDYEFSKNDFEILEKELPFADRPLFSLWKAKYQDLVIKEHNTGKTVYKESLDLFKNDLETLKSKLPIKIN